MMKKTIIGGFAFLTLFMTAYLWLPWKPLIEARVEDMLQSRGFQNISFKIGDVGLRQATLVSVRIGKENPLILQSVELQYSLNELLKGTLRDIVFTGVELEIRESKADGWSLAGMDVLPKGEGAFDMGAFVKGLPFTSLAVKDSHLKIVGTSLQGTVPFSLVLAKSPAMSLNVLFDGAEMIVGASKVPLGKSYLKAFPLNGHPESWAGEWGVESVDPAAAIPFPVLRGKGDFAMEKSLVRLGGDFISGDKAYKVSVEQKVDIDKPETAVLKLSSASFPFKEGHVSTQNVVLKMPLSAVINVQNVSVDALLQSLTGKRVTATGTMSGSVPINIRKDGSYSFGKGSLKADGNGQIQMSGDAIPGDSEQIVLVREILENLHYSLLSANVESDENGKVAVLLKLEGNNPDVYNGRQVKLNVNLTGDILDFFQQNLMLLNTPEKLLQQETHE